MSHKPISEFTETELWVVRSTLKERYGHDVELQFAETETPTPESGGMTWCPTLFWSAKGANFAVIKTGAKRFRPIFYYHPEVQLGTGVGGLRRNRRCGRERAPGRGRPYSEAKDQA